jgi:hypothetical protein
MTTSENMDGNRTLDNRSQLGLYLFLLDRQ